MHRQLIFILCALFLAACQPVSQPTPTIDVPAIQTVAAATAYVQFTKTAAVPSLTPTFAITPRPTDRPYPTQLPAIDPFLLETKLTVQPETFNGYTIQKITGWDHGFKEYEWMDENHLLLSAIIGPVSAGQSQNYPGIFVLDSQIVWVPRLTDDAMADRSLIGVRQTLPRWSAKLAALITTETISSGEAVVLYSADGDFIAMYPGKLRGISPSGTKIVVDKGTWIDLISGKKVDLAWDEKYFDWTWSNLNWSEDEMQVFMCCHLYGNAKTGESLSFSSSELFGYGTWVFNDNYFLPESDYVKGLPVSSGNDYIPLFNLSTKTFFNVSELAGVPLKFDDFPNRCNWWYISPNKKFVWADCFDGNHLIDLATFEGEHYPQIPSGRNVDIIWSADSSFAKIRTDDNDSEKIISMTSKELKTVPDDYRCHWHPTGNVLLCQSIKSQTTALLDAQTMAFQLSLQIDPPCKIADYDNNGLALCLSDDEQTLLVLNTRIFSIQEKVDLPIKISTSKKSLDGNRLALLAQDGSLWLVDYPSLGNIEQLTPATISQIGQISWSPDSRYLAFLGDMDIYIVDTISTP